MNKEISPIGMDWEDYKIQYMNDEERKELKARTDFIVKLIDLRNEEVTQKELSNKTGLAQSVISRIETGKSSPTLDTVIKMLAGMGYELDIVPTQIK